MEHPFLFYILPNISGLFMTISFPVYLAKRMK